MLEKVKPYIETIHTTAPGLLLIGMALYELYHRKEITANAMGLIATGWACIKSQTIKK